MEAFEITMTGPTLKFHGDAVIALCGAAFKMLLNGQPVSSWARHLVQSGSELQILETTVGARAYLAILGGLPSIATYLGSKSTAPSLNWGGYQGRCLKSGDFLSLKPLSSKNNFQPYQIPEACIPRVGSAPRLFALPGPWFSAPFLSPKGKEHMFNFEFKLSHNSNRVGVRMEGLSPSWGREDGGEGGSHPSNMVGFGAPNGSVAFTGDSGIVYAVDGPDLTGKSPFQNG
jgi:allophanate hydrolase subunit 2